MPVLNDLYDYGLKIYQDEDSFKFSLDSLLLAEFTEVSNKPTKLLDLCTGNAPLPLILASTHPHLTITGLEIQEVIAALAEKSIAYNNLSSQITILNINAKSAKDYFPGNNFDIITCNPPFFKTTATSLLNANQIKAIARHELTITLADIIDIASYLLKDRGAFYLVHRPERIEEIISLASNKSLRLKKVIFIYPKPEECAIMVLLKFVKNGQIGTKVASKIVNRDTKTYQNIFRN